MILTEETIIQFQELYQCYFGTEISIEDAESEAIKLIKVVGITVKS